MPYTITKVECGVQYGLLHEDRYRFVHYERLVHMETHCILSGQLAFGVDAPIGRALLTGCLGSKNVLYIKHAAFWQSMLLAGPPLPLRFLVLFGACQLADVLLFSCSVARDSDWGDVCRQGVDAS